MIKTIVLFLAISIGQSFSISSAQANLFQGANQVKPKEFVAGAFGLLSFSPTEIQAIAQGIYGLNQKVQLEARLGVGQMSTSLGIYGKAHFLSTELVNMALWAGARIQSGLGIEGALILSHAFSKFELYGGPVMDLFFKSGASNLGLGFIPGVAVPLSNKMRFYGEAVLSLASYYNAVSGGVRFYF